MRIVLFASIALFVFNSSYAQFGNRFKNGLRYYLDTEDSARYIALNMTSQIWFRHTETNPYTTVYGNAENAITDFSIRRIRFVLSGQLTDRVSFFMQFGQNNLNYLSPRKAGSFFHDVTTDFAFIKKKLSIGFGLNGWDGPSRFSNISVTSILVLDPPAYQEVTNDTYDQFVRRLGVYAKGKLGKLDYRLSWAKPFVIQTTSGSGTEAINTNATFSTLPPRMVSQGYLMYQFLDQESNFGPGNAGTYLGKKKIFNIGAGFYLQKDAMFHYAPATQDTIMQNLKLFALDVFYDSPLNKEKGTAVSLYACISSYDFGKNFIKVGGSDNPANGSSTPVASAVDKSNYGNALPYLGTGTIGYVQAGYKFADNMLGNLGTLQPFVNWQHSQYDRLGSAVNVYDIGLNWLIAGHNSKFTLDYQNRPYFATDANQDIKEVSRKGQFVLQYQVAF
ncbi:MAG TPA: hypothetical protein VF490_09210 [Chryseosolibacter sp.]